MKRLSQAKHGFTLIEVLVVITILVILASMLLVGMKFLSKSSRSTATHVTLANAKSMFAEFESATGLRRQPPAMWRTDISGAVPKPHEGLATETTLAGTTLPKSIWTEPVFAPGDVTQASYDSQFSFDRLESDASLDLGNIMMLVESVAANQKAIQGLPGGQIVALNAFTPWMPTPAVVSVPPPPYNQGDCVGRYAASSKRVGYFVWTTAASGNTDPATGGAGWQAFVPSSATPWTVGNNYVSGSCVSTSTGGYFVAMSPHVASAANAPGTAPTIWAQYRRSQGLLDAWGNPIIFVPSGGLIVGAYQGIYGAGTYRAGDCVSVAGPYTQYYFCLKDSPGPLTDQASWKDALVRSPDKKAFFASAGADGRFNWYVDPNDPQKRIDGASDNIYSFEQ